MTKRMMFVATKARVFATLATAGVMVGGVAGLEAQATEQASAEMKLAVIQTETAQQRASIDRFVHPAPAAVIAAPTATATSGGVRTTTTGAPQPAVPSAAAPAPAPVAPAPVAPATGGTNGTSGGSQ